MAIISLNALSCKINGGNQTLLGKLYEDDVVSLTSIEMVDMLKETGHETISTPSNLEIVQQGSDYILTWTAPYENVTNYDVYVSTEYNGEYSLFSTPSNSYIPLTDSVLYDLNDDTIYYFKVRAVKWDETKEQRYFSDLSAPISYQVTKTNNAPLNVVSQITNYLSDAAQNEQNALYMCQAAMTATSAYYGKYYAERAQEYYAKIEVDIEAAIELCGDYDNLADLKVPFATIYSLNVYAANYQITSTNYLSYVIETSTNASALTDYYEQSLAIIKTIIAEY